MLKIDCGVSLAVVPVKYLSTTGMVSVLKRYLGGGGSVGPVVPRTPVPPMP